MRELAEAGASARVRAMNDGGGEPVRWAVTEGSAWVVPVLVAGALGMATLVVWAVRRILRDMRDAGVALVRATGESGERLAERLAAIVRDRFHVEPTIRINGRVVSEGTFAARELVTRKQVLTCRREKSHQWLGSTKQITMEATFTVKAGFDLGRPIRIEVGPDGQRAEVEWPEARILSVEAEGFVPAEESSGWWNRITPEDRAELQAELKRAAAAEARAGGLLREAETELRQLLSNQLGEDGARLAVHFGSVEPRRLGAGEDRPAIEEVAKEGRTRPWELPGNAPGAGQRTAGGDGMPAT